MHLLDFARFPRRLHIAKTPLRGRTKPHRNERTSMITHQ